MISVLDAIEQQLVQAAELHLTGTLTEALYISTLRGALAVLPTSEAPGHISRHCIYPPCVVRLLSCQRPRHQDTSLCSSVSRNGKRVSSFQKMSISS